MHNTITKFIACCLVVLSMLIQAASAHAQKSRKLFADVPIERGLSSDASNMLDKIKNRPTTAEVRIVKMQLPVLADTRTPVTFNLLPGTDMSIKFDSTEKKSAQEYIWRGKTDNGGTATLVVRGKKVTGTVRSGNEIYSVEPLGDGNHAIIKINPSKFPMDHPPEFEKIEKPITDRPATMLAPTATATSVATLTPAAAAGTLVPIKGFASPCGTVCTKTTIDVIVAYTSAAKTAHADMDGLITLAVDEANQSYVKSKIPIALRLVHKYQVTYNESGNYDTDLTRFRTNSDGFMDDIHTKRTTYKADLAVLIINNSSYCGLASAILADKNTAFAAVYWDCATGYFSFAHEIGHLQGARHDKRVDASDTPYIYGHGYVNTTAGWRTIMGYNDPTCPGGSCTRIQQWSNPDVIYSGAATGTENNNFNAMVLTRTRGTVAGFK